MIRPLLAVAALLLLQACSAIKLGYQQLPTLSYWWLDNTVSFSGTQTPVRVVGAVLHSHLDFMTQINP